MLSVHASSQITLIKRFQERIYVDIIQQDAFKKFKICFRAFKKSVVSRFNLMSIFMMKHDDNNTIFYLQIVLHGYTFNYGARLKSI